MPFVVRASRSANERYATRKLIKRSGDVLSRSHDGSDCGEEILLRNRFIRTAGLNEFAQFIGRGRPKCSRSEDSDFGRVDAGRPALSGPTVRRLVVSQLRSLCSPGAIRERPISRYNISQAQRRGRIGRDE